VSDSSCNRHCSESSQLPLRYLSCVTSWCVGKTHSRHVYVDDVYVDIQVWSGHRARIAQLPDTCSRLPQASHRMGSPRNHMQLFNHPKPVITLLQFLEVVHVRSSAQCGSWDEERGNGVGNGVRADDCVNRNRSGTRP